jgi:hypothetical protein
VESPRTLKPGRQAGFFVVWSPSEIRFRSFPIEEGNHQAKEIIISTQATPKHYLWLYSQ